MPLNAALKCAAFRPGHYSLILRHTEGAMAFKAEGAGAFMPLNAALKCAAFRPGPSSFLLRHSEGAGAFRPLNSAAGTRGL